MKKIIYSNIIAVAVLLFGNYHYAEASQLPKINIKLNLKEIINFDGKFKFNEFLDARRGGGGGSRGGSFGRSRSSSSSRSSTNKSSGSSSRSGATLSRNPAKSPSFGGTRMSREAATAKYGVPRKTQSVTSKNELGQNMNYRVNDYGGFSSSLMMGYMMGNMSWWMMAPSLLYSRPVYVENKDGSVDVYPPSFSFTKLFLWIIAIIVVIFIIKAIIKSKKDYKQFKSSGSFM